MISKIDDGKFMLSNFCIVLSFIKKGEIVSFPKLNIYLSICFDERQKGISHLYISCLYCSIIFKMLCVTIILLYDIYDINGLMFFYYILFGSKY